MESTQKLEKLIKEIMAEMEKDGCPVTREEAEEMAIMEINSSKERRYEQSDKPRKKATKERKVDKEKLVLLELVKDALTENTTAVDFRLTTETELTFFLNDNFYTFKLTKHGKKWLDKQTFAH